MLALSEEGYTQREIAARVGCSQGSVSDILKKQRLTGSVNDAQIPGRRRKTSEREDQIIVRKSKSNHFKTAQEIKVEMQNKHAVSVSLSTTKRRLREVGLKGYKPRENHALLLAIRNYAYNLLKHTKIGQKSSGPKWFSAMNQSSAFTGVTGEFM